MNTGIQGSGSTPFMAATTTTPAGKASPRKNMLEIAAAHGIPYAASASVAYIDDLNKKVTKAKTNHGPSYLHIHTPCPTGWGFEPSLTIQVARAAVQTGAWVLMEIENSKPIPNRKTRELKPVTDYLKLQKRFNHLTETDIQYIQEEIIHNMKNITDRAFTG
jgi:pyruvate ferredoxin oxidoreductase beta subunit